MAGTKFTLRGSEEMKRKLRDISNEVGGRKAQAALRLAAAPIVNRAKELAPVRTGTLRRSIAVEDGPGELEVSIGTDVEYAIFQEFGTVHMAARPFLRPALEQEGPAFGKELASILGNLMEAAAR